MEKEEIGKVKEKEKLCKRCKQSFTSSSNASSACRFHPSFFVCRRHDDQKRAVKDDKSSGPDGGCIEGCGVWKVL
ncbi:uncharacterized protein LOC131178730 isoform X2 [Hevea brasiliensis]|uniref:uncharacterized protein LOC110647198 isoform X2 n=1 Tax=Hevea brasiliensis TaxID=3981 RepID=UPI000B7980FD|nr:uncharacterized protein LOC110647198 isoform X2 [Hevea brasiliensis]XP_058000306.1 uncharacterized protein LOC131178730 isoform X2 [Hevea brasiliensis]